MPALLVLPVAAGLVLGLLLGGRLKHLLDLRFRALWLLWAAVAVQALTQFDTPVRHLVQLRFGWCLVFAPVLAWAIVNIAGSTGPQRFSLLAILLGAVANLAPLLANGRMPYRLRSASTAVQPVHTLKNEPATAHTHLAALGDLWHLPALHATISHGDILIAAGSATLIAAAMRPAPALPPSNPPAPDPPAQPVRNQTEENPHAQAHPPAHHVPALHDGDDRHPALHDRGPGDRRQLTARSALFARGQRVRSGS